MTLTHNMKAQLKSALSKPAEKTPKLEVEVEDDTYTPPPQVSVCLSCDDGIAQGKFFCSECEACFSKCPPRLPE